MEIDQWVIYLQLKQFDLCLAYSKLQWTLLITHLGIKKYLYEAMKFKNLTGFYVYRINNQINWSLLLKHRTGCLDLEIETSRWSGKPEDQRICKLCTCFYFIAVNLMNPIREQYKK